MMIGKTGYLTIKVQNLNHFLGSYPQALLILQAYFYAMIIHDGYEKLRLNSPVTTMGIFDGVHRGHKALIGHLVMQAEKTHSESVVITFFPHPRLVLEPGNTELAFLSTMEEKIKLLEQASVDHLIVIQFTKQFSSITACDFIRDILIEKVGTRHLIIGYDHHFGRRGEGDINTIQECSEAMGFRVDKVDGLRSADGAISSSIIREALLKGNLDDANNWLGYNYSVTGTVIEGKRLGRTIGFPTANILPDSANKLIPCNGVYAVEVKLGDEIFPGMLNIGSNPTVNSDKKFRSIEVNILNFDRDIYSKTISVVFRKRLRDERKFDGLEALKVQMMLDRQHTLKILS
jgi:riboflavin kinase / FMN adenylyltransferase